MSRPILHLAIAVALAIPCSAQNISGWSNEAGGWQWAPGLATAWLDDHSESFCTAAKLVDALTVVFWVVKNYCTGTTEIMPITTYATFGTAPANIHPAATGGNATSPGVGSEALTATALANGSYLAAWVTGTTLVTGVFTASSATVPTGGQYTVGPNPQHVIAADFNGDGNVDLAVSNYGDSNTGLGGNLQIFLGNGAGGFTPGATVNAGSTPGPMYAADFNGDGKLDLAVGNQLTGTVSVVLGNGDGTFQAPPSYPAAVLPSSIVSADFNGDGYPDLAAADYLGGLWILLGSAGGAFQPARKYASGIGQPTYLATIDLNGDGKPDLIVADPVANAFSFLFGNGDGSFQAPVEYATAADAETFGLASGNGQLQIGTADAVSGHFVVTPVSSSGLAGAPLIYQLPQPVTGVAAAPLTGDGYPDMVAADQAISVLLRVPGGAFQAPVNYALQSGSQAVAVAVGDLNGDGMNDVVAASVATPASGNQGGTVDVALNNGNGTLGTQSSYAIGGYPGGNSTPPSGILIADFNGDGKPDVAAGYEASPGGVGAGGISVLMNQGGGALSPAVNYTVGGLSVLGVVTGDFNGDGKPDIAAAAGSVDYTPPGALAILLGNGDGTFQPAALTQVGSPAGTLVALAAADVNGDGKLDIVASVWDANFNDTIVVLLGNGDGTFRQLAPFTTGASGYAVALPDLNGDGIPDLVVGDCCGLSESVYLLGNGDGTFQSPVYFSSGAEAMGFAVTSWNNDGVAGLAIAQQGGTVEAMVSMLNPKLYSSPPTLSITSSHTGNFTQGQQGAIYTIAVSNAANAAPVNNLVTVTDTVPSGLSLVSMTGDNWTCSANMCTRSDALAGGFSYDPITVTVNVAANAASPQVNSVTVTGGGSASASATDSTVIGGGSGITIGTSPTGLQFTVDGTAYTAPETLNLTQGSHTIAVVSPQAGAAGTQYVFSSWSDNGAASHTITVGSSAATYTATFQAQYQLTISASPAASGTVTPVSGSYYNSGTAVAITATPASGYTFAGWTGAVASASSASTTVTMSGPETVVANFSTVSTPTFTLSPTSANVGAAGGTGSVTVTASVQTAAWTASSNNSFLTITSGASGTGNGTVGYSVAANATGSARTGTLTIAGQTFTVTQAAATATAGLAFYPVTPCRIADTRTGQGFTGQFGPPSMTAGQTRSFTIPASSCNIPSTAQAYSLNVTVVPAATLGYLTIWPTGETQPYVSTLNSLNGAILANAAIVPAGTAGAVSVYVTDATDLIIDINGYFAPAAGSSALAFYPVTPCRVADTRNPNGAFGGPSLPAGGTRSFTVPSSSCNIPTTAQAYSLNMTVVPPGPLTYLTTWPTGQTQPYVSTLNALQGQIAANAAIVPAGAGGAISVYVSNASNVIVDINGYFAPPGGTGALYFYPLTPCRVADTRNATGTFGGPSLGAGGTRTFPIPSSSCSVPSNAQAFSFNMTVVPPGSLLYLSTWPAGQTQPVVSTLNDLQGQVVANAAIVPAGTGSSAGGISVFVSDPTNVIIDINGYFGQ